MRKRVGVLVVIVAATATAAAWLQQSLSRAPAPLRQPMLIDVVSPSDCSTWFFEWKTLNGNRGLDEARRRLRSCLRSVDTARKRYEAQRASACRKMLLNLALGKSTRRQRERLRMLYCRTAYDPSA